MAAQKMKEEKAPEPEMKTKEMASKTDDKDTRLWSALCYVFPVLVSIIVMVTDKKENKTVMFHAWQSLILGIIWWGLSMFLLCPSVLWVVFLFFAYKVYNGDKLELPTVSEFARKQVK